MTVDTDGRVIGLARDTVHVLRRTLERELGDRTADVLQEVGYALGNEMYPLFTEWLRSNTDTDDPSLLDQEYMAEVLSRYFRELGWGTLELERIGRAGLLLKSDGWSESDPNSGALFPSCFLTTGMLASMLSRMADATVAVMEVECRSRQDGVCGFLIGSPENLQLVYESMPQGGDYRSVLGS